MVGFSKAGGEQTQMGHTNLKETQFKLKRQFCVLSAHGMFVMYAILR